MYDLESIFKYKEAQYVFVYNECKKGERFHTLVEHSEFKGEYTTCHSEWTMYTLQDDCLPVIKVGGDCAIRGEVYKVNHQTFKNLVGFNYGMLLRKVKVEGFKKRVWIWELSKDATKFLLKTLDKPANKVYNWGKLGIPDTTPAKDTTVHLTSTQAKQQSTKPWKETKKMAVPTKFDPNVSSDDKTQTVNKDSFIAKLLNLMDDLDDAIWDSEMDNAKRGSICRDSLKGMRELCSDVSKITWEEAA